ncbi:oligosaccharide flippase family protein [Luminiphilus sp.]|nr:oligosaccharide flippase family protein [Luminiphilus sp.]
MKFITPIDPAKRELHASILSFLMIAITRVLHYAASLILLSFLSPEAFGVMAIVTSVLAMMNSVSAFGVDAALISYAGDEKEIVNEAWTLELLKGVSLAAVTIMISPFLASWLATPALELLLVVMSAAFILQSGKNIGLVSLRRRMEFTVIFQCEIAMAVVNFFVTISLVMFYQSPWIIVAGYLSGWLTYFFLSYFLCDFRPKVSLRWRRVSGILNYSKWVLLSGQINAMLDHGINFFTGSQYGMSVLGQFERANMFTRQTSLQIGEVLWRVGLPSLASRVENIAELRSHYLNMIAFLCAFVFPVLILVVLYIPVLVSQSNPSAWSEFYPLVLSLGFVAGISILVTPGTILFQAVREPRFGMNVAVTRLLTVGLFLMPCVKLFGVIGVVYALAGGSLVVLPVCFFYVKRLIGVSFWEHIVICVQHLIPCAPFLFISPSELSVGFNILSLCLALLSHLVLMYACSEYFRSVTNWLQGVLDRTRSPRNAA